MVLEGDVFISYAHDDNEPVIKGETGWVSKFHRALEVRLGQLIKKPIVWRDPKLKGYDEFGEEISAKIAKTKVLLVIISPLWLESEWCMRELREFLEAAENTGGVKLGNKNRVIKIIKTPVHYENHPVEIRGLLGYDFFHLDKLGEKDYPHEFLLERGAPFYYEFRDKLDEVVYDIRDLITLINEIDRPDVSKSEPPVSAPEKTVYLAETTSDLDKERENIYHELKQAEYTILPDQRLPYQLKDGNFRDAVRDYLECCSLSIHLIGSQYGLIPEGEEQSVIDLQNQAASEQCKKNRLSRLIWIPPGVRKDEIEDKRQKEYIENLEDDVPEDGGTDLLDSQIEIEDFKTIIDDKLEEINNPPPPPPPPGGPTCVYLVYDKKDSDSVESVCECLDRQEFEILRPFERGSEGQRLKLNTDYLTLCDAMLVYYDHGDDYWVQTKMNDIRRARGFERKSDLKASVFITGEKTGDKERFFTREAQVVKKYIPSYCNALKDIIDLIKG
jgi:hypothetical protein